LPPGWHQGLVLPTFTGKSDVVLPGVLLQVLQRLMIDHPSQPGGIKRGGEDAGDHGPEAGPDKHLHIGLLVRVPERVETPQVQVPADALDPGGLVYGKEGPGYHAFDAMAFHGQTNRTGEVRELNLLNSFGLDGNKGKTGSLRLQGDQVHVGGMEHVALFVPGANRDEACHLLFLHGQITGKKRIFPPRTENPESHSIHSGTLRVLNLSLPVQNNTVKKAIAGWWKEVSAGQERVR
jgi:hypothetical protein